MRAQAARIPQVMVLLAASSTIAVAQETQFQFWPELDAFINLNPTTRVFLLGSFRNQDNNPWRGTFGAHFDIALKPIFRRDLRSRADVFKRRFLSFRGGFRYISSLGDGGQPYLEHRWIVELTARYPLPAKLILIDRNRGDLRFINGQGFSTRYRNRAQVERDFGVGPLTLTPYVNGELFYDTRYDTWNRTRYSVGIQAQAGDHLVLEPYYLRQNDTRSSIRHVNALGFKVILYF